MEETIFYDITGTAVAYMDNKEKIIYLFTGKAVAYIIENELVFSFNGRHLGWYENGWVTDLIGYREFFTEHASGGPTMLMKKTPPVKSQKQITPAKQTCEPIKIKLKSLSWSELSGEKFFLTN